MKQIILIVLTIIILTSCVSTPDQFKAGDPTSAPKGCIEMRERGGKC